MEINLNQLSAQKSESTVGRTKMRLSENAQSMVFQMFTKNIYSNPIGTVVREITSNCFDSHVEAGVNSPVIIRKTVDKADNTIYISFIDFGVGMSPDRVENIYGVYFESTKRADNSQIGGFGIGGKTPLAYKRSTGHGEGEYDNSFFAITNFDGMKYYYCISEGEECPEISLLHQEETTERNGTEIRIPVLEKDLYSFKKEMTRQLYYFENVVFEGFDADDFNSNHYDEILTNTYTIVRGKNFLFRGTEYANEMHVCLGRVAYPIDYNVLGLSINDFRLPIAIRLEVGEINPTANRETLDYNEHTIKIIKKKLAQAKQEITELLAKEYSNIVTLEDYFKVKNQFGVLTFANGVSINVGNLIKQSDIDFSNFKYGFMKMPNDKQLFKFFFNTKTYGKKTRSRSRYNSKTEFEGGYDEIFKNSNLLYIDGEFTRKVVKQSYLKHIHEQYHIINRRNLCEFHMRGEIAELFNVHLDKTCDDNGKPVAYIQSLIDMQEEFFTIVRSNAKNYDTLEVPEDFIINRKKKDSLSEEIRKTTIPVKLIGTYSKTRVRVQDLIDYKMPIFYGTQEDESALRSCHDLFSELFDKRAVVRNYYDNYFLTGYDDYYRKPKKDNVKNSIMFVVVAQANVKYFEYCKKAYKASEFFTRMLYRKEEKVMSYYQTHDLISKWNGIGDLYKTPNFKKVNDSTGKKIAEIVKYIDNLPNSDNSIGNFEHLLLRYFDFSKIKKTGEQERIDRLIDEIKKVEILNEKTLQYIYFRYDSELTCSTLVEVLKKVMVF
ncbi:MAG: ATP-binding protein [Bacteroidales bacterium]|nr:ATP-binding protein [Bacteroidales bacterium]